MDIRIQLLPTNEVPQESAKTRPGISDLGVHVSVLAPLPAVGADTDREYFKHLSSTSYSPPRSPLQSPAAIINLN